MVAQSDHVQSDVDTWQLPKSPPSQSMNDSTQAESTSLILLSILVSHLTSLPTADIVCLRRLSGISHPKPKAFLLTTAVIVDWFVRAFQARIFCSCIHYHETQMYRA